MGRICKTFAEEDEVTNNVTVFIEENASLWSMLRAGRNRVDFEDRDEQKKLIQKVMQYAIEIPKTMVSACRSFCANIYTEDDEPIFALSLKDELGFE